jgi:hypothetical protein
MPENANRRAHLHQHLGRSSTRCIAWFTLDQRTPQGMRPSAMCCVRCGAATPRRSLSGQPWCGGEMVTPEQRVAEIAPATFIGGDR